GSPFAAGGWPLAARSARRCCHREPSTPAASGTPRDSSCAATATSASSRPQAAAICTPTGPPADGRSQDNRVVPENGGDAYLHVLHVGAGVVIFGGRQLQAFANQGGKLSTD